MISWASQKNHKSSVIRLRLKEIFDFVFESIRIQKKSVSARIRSPLQICELVLRSARFGETSIPFAEAQFQMALFRRRSFDSHRHAVFSVPIPFLSDCNLAEYSKFIADPSRLA